MEDYLCVFPYKRSVKASLSVSQLISTFFFCCQWESKLQVWIVNPHFRYAPTQPFRKFFLGRRLWWWSGEKKKNVCSRSPPFKTGEWDRGVQFLITVFWGILWKMIKLFCVNTLFINIDMFWGRLKWLFLKKRFSRKFVSFFKCRVRWEKIRALGYPRKKSNLLATPPFPMLKLSTINFNLYKKMFIKKKQWKRE